MSNRTTSTSQLRVKRGSFYLAFASLVVAALMSCSTASAATCNLRVKGMNGGHSGFAGVGGNQQLSSVRINAKGIKKHERLKGSFRVQANAGGVIYDSAGAVVESFGVIEANTKKTFKKKGYLFLKTRISRKAREALSAGGSGRIKGSISAEFGSTKCAERSFELPVAVIPPLSKTVTFKQLSRTSVRVSGRLGAGGAPELKRNYFFDYFPKSLGVNERVKRTANEVFDGNDAKVVSMVIKHLKPGKTYYYRFGATCKGKAIGLDGSKVDVAGPAYGLYNSFKLRRNFKKR